eukprot:3345789-Rhodomonas_salina.1
MSDPTASESVKEAVGSKTRRMDAGARSMLFMFKKQQVKQDAQLRDNLQKLLLLMPRKATGI